MTSKNPLISVVIPTYNSEEFIENTLNSVFNQTYKNFEVIVSDDGSSDKTKEIVINVFAKHLNRQTKLLVNAHQGPGAARNKGILAAQAEWIAFLDSDDLWRKQKLEKVANYLQENDPDLVCHNEIRKNGDQERLFNCSKRWLPDKTPFLSLYKRNAFLTSAVTTRKKLLLKAGLFDESLPSAQDYDLWLRLALLPNLKIGFIEEPLGFYITREENISSKPEKRLNCLLKISQKTYSDLKKESQLAYFLKQRFKGRVYASVGLDLLKKNRFKGIYYFLKGLILWPFRFDWAKKIVRVVRNSLS